MYGLDNQYHILTYVQHKYFKHWTQDILLRPNNMHFYALMCRLRAVTVSEATDGQDYPRGRVQAQGLVWQRFPPAADDVCRIQRRREGHVRW